jgi:membrane fusion protein (multidrug efflux system)
MPASPAAAVALALLVVMGSACQNGDASETEENATPDSTSSAAASDSSSAAAGADSSSGDTLSEGRRSWKDRMFGKKEEQKEKERPVPVELADVAIRDIPAYLSSTTTLEPDKEADVLAKASGELKEIHVEEGDWVREGAILATLDGRAQGAALEEVAARVRGLQLELDRMVALHGQSLASDRDLEAAQTAFAQAEAQRKSFELELAYTTIRAPFAGRVTRRMADAGQNVAVGAHLFTVVDADPLLARIYLPEREVARLAPNQEVRIQSDADPTIEMAGSVHLIAPVVDTRTGTIKVTCKLDGETGKLRPGSFVRVKVETGVHDNVAAIPKRALVPEGADTYVFRAEADSVVKTSIQTGLSTDEWVEVLEGLEVGDRVVKVGHGALRTGTKVRDLASPASPDSTSVNS